MYAIYLWQQYKSDWQFTQNKRQKQSKRYVKISECNQGESSLKFIENFTVTTWKHTSNLKSMWLLWV